jgi:Protein of unknown function (DUF3551)
MIKFIAVSVALMAAMSVGGASGAKADPYRWCAEGLGQTGSSNCYFLTLEQCREAASGLGGICVHNNFYTGPDTAGPTRRRK